MLHSPGMPAQLTCVCASALTVSALQNPTFCCSSDQSHNQHQSRRPPLRRRLEVASQWGFSTSNLLLKSRYTPGALAPILDEYTLSV